MKILYINALYDPYIAGGAEISLKLIVEQMQAKGYEVVVLSMVPQGKLHVDMVDGIPVYRVGLHNLYWPFAKEKPDPLRRFLWHLRDTYNPTMGRYVRQVIQLEQPDIVSCHNLVGWSIAVWDEIRRAGLPVIQVLHDMYLLSPDSTLFHRQRGGLVQRLLSKLMRRRHKSQSARMGAVVGISHSVLDRFLAQGYFQHVSCHVVHNARLIPAAHPPRLRSEGQPLTVGYIGTLSAPKGVEWLIRQFKATAIEGKLRIAGRGKEEDMLYFRELAGADARIEFVGYVEPGVFYSTVDVLVVPSLWEEPLGMVAVEGLANNLPVVASNRGGLREIVMDGINGIRCDPDRPESLGDALVGLWRDVAWYNRLAGEARASVSRFLDVNRMVSEYEQVVKATLTHRADA